MYSGAVTKLYSTDGTTVTQVSNIAGAAADDDPQSLTVYGGKLYFTARNAAGLGKLYAYDGTSIILVTNTAGAGNDDAPANLAVAGSKLYLSAKDSSGAVKLYSVCDAAQGCTP